MNHDDEPKIKERPRWVAPVQKINFIICLVLTALFFLIASLSVAIFYILISNPLAILALSVWFLSSYILYKYLSTHPKYKDIDWF